MTTTNTTTHHHHYQHYQYYILSHMPPDAAASAADDFEPQPWEPITTDKSTGNSTEQSMGPGGSMEGKKGEAEDESEGGARGGSGKARAEGGENGGEGETMEVAEDEMEVADEDEDAGGPNLTDILSGALTEALSVQRKALGDRLDEFVRVLKHALTELYSNEFGFGSIGKTLLNSEHFQFHEACINQTNRHEASTIKILLFTTTTLIPTLVRR